MIVSKFHRYVYMGMPKTGSQAMCKWLADNHAGVKLRPSHRIHLPDGCEGYFIFTQVRDPYERCLSWWLHERDFDPPKEIHPTFEDKLRYLIEYKDGGNPSKKTPESSMSQARIIEALKERNGIADVAVVRLEHPEDLKILPFVKEARPCLPVHGVGGTRNRTFPRKIPARNVISPAQEALVWEFCGEDFAEFGYERETYGVTCS